MKKPGYKGKREQVRALSAYVKLVRAAESVTARIHRHLADVNLTLSQFGVLEALFHLGPLSQVDLAKKILRSSGNVTMVIDNLEKRGLVSRERDRGDRRYYRIHLTTSGRRLMSGVFTSHADRISKEMGILTQAEQEELARLCRKLGLGKEERQKGS